MAPFKQRHFLNKCWAQMPQSKTIACGQLRQSHHTFQLSYTQAIHNSDRVWLGVIWVVNASTILVHLTMCKWLFLLLRASLAMINHAIEWLDRNRWQSIYTSFTINTFFFQLKKYYPLTFYMPHIIFSIDQLDHKNVAEKNTIIQSNLSWDATFFALWTWPQKTGDHKLEVAFVIKLPWPQNVLSN